MEQKPGETRLVIVEFPADFPVKELAGKKADYAVTLREIKEKVLPAIDDALAAKLAPGKTLTDLRQMIEHDIEHAKEHDVERAKEAQILKYLHEHIQFELPSALLQNETRRALAELVQRNRERGVTDEMLKEKEKELIDGAAGVAAHRLKTNFILHRIAEGEKIQVTKEDVDASHHAGGGALQHFISRKCARSCSKKTRWTTWPNRFCLVRLLIS